MKLPDFGKHLRKLKPLPEKDGLYFELEDACKTETCPVCSLLERREKQHIENIFYEHVNDPHLRKRFHESGGFCSRHIERLLEIGDALGLAIIGADMISTIIESDSFEMIASQCFFCKEYREREERIIDAFSGYLTYPEFRECLSRGRGLCWRHFREVLSANNDPRIGIFIKELLKKKLRIQFHHLNEFIRKNDYRFQDETIPPGEAIRIGIIWRLFRR